MIDLIAFDADDTLWENETLYLEARVKFEQILAPFASVEDIDQRLSDIEIANLDIYGYGIKSFALSMTEAAISLSANQITAVNLQSVIQIVHDILTAEIRLFSQVEETLAILTEDYPLMLITKGDLFEQERKVSRSGVAGYFEFVEVLGQKTAESYRDLLHRYGQAPEGFLMIGNSLRSDILPVISIGAQAIYIPYAHTWHHEHVEAESTAAVEYHEVEHMGQVPALILNMTGQI
jgi:putative hydrolase of the HAD superfamily